MNYEIFAYRILHRCNIVANQLASLRLEVCTIVFFVIGCIALCVSVLLVSCFAGIVLPAWPSKDYGYIDRAGRTVLPMSRLLFLGSFRENTALVKVVPGDVSLIVKTIEGFAHGNWKTGSCWFINKSGNAAISEAYEEALPFSEGLAAVKLGNSWGFIDHTGKIIVDPRFYRIGQFKNGMAPVCTSSYWGFIDTSGREVIGEKFDEVGSFQDGLAPAKLGKGVGFINVHGNWMINPEYEKAGCFSEGLAFVQDAEHAGYIDKSGKMRILVQKQTAFAGPTVTSELNAPLSESSCLASQHLWVDVEQSNMRNYIADIFKFSENCAVVKHNGHYGYVDRSGVFVISPRFDYAYPFKENRALVLQHGRFGYLDHNGITVVPPNFDYAMPFSEGFAAVHLQGKWAYIDRNGRVAIPPKFENASPFSEGYATVGNPDI